MAYPLSPVIWTDKIDYIDTVKAADVNQIYAETIAVEEDLINEIKPHLTSVDTQLADIAYFPVTNLVINSDFSNGTTGWSTNGNTAVVDGRITRTPNATNQIIAQTLSGLTVGHKYFISADIEGISTTALFVANPVIKPVKYLNKTGRHRLSQVVVANDTSMQIGMVDMATSNWVQYYMDDVVCIDLSARFGAGREPSAMQMDNLLLQYSNSWFEGNVNLIQASGFIKSQITVNDMTFDMAINVKSFGATGNGTTDDSSAILAALNELWGLGGGTLFFPLGTYVMNSQLAMPVDSTEYTVPIRIKGVANRARGVRNVLNSGGSALDLRYTGSDGKITGKGFGTLGIEDIHLMQTSSSADTTPFVFITRTTPYIQRVSVQGHSTLSSTSCIQDAFVFGNSTGLLDNPPAFRGYGGFVKDCVFDRIRSGIVARKGLNGFLFENLGWSIYCGSDGTHGAIDMKGTGEMASSNLFLNMIIEILGYVYPIILYEASWNVFVNTQFWDVTTNTLYLIKVYNCQKNTFLCANSYGFPNIITGDNSANDIYFHDLHTGYYNMMRVTQLNVNNATFGDSLTQVPGAVVTINSTTRGFRPPAMTTLQRDAITSCGEGLVVYNLTTHTLDFYNGSVWKQNAGV